MSWYLPTYYDDCWYLLLPFGVQLYPLAGTTNETQDILETMWRFRCEVQLAVNSNTPLPSPIFEDRLYQRNARNTLQSDLRALTYNFLMFLWDFVFFAEPLAVITLYLPLVR